MAHYNRVSPYHCQLYRVIHKTFVHRIETFSNPIFLVDITNLEFSLIPRPGIVYNKLAIATFPTLAPSASSFMNIHLCQEVSAQHSLACYFAPQKSGGGRLLRVASDCSVKLAPVFLSNAYPHYLRSCYHLSFVMKFEALREFCDCFNGQLVSR